MKGDSIMALETLKGVEKIGGFDVINLEELKRKHTDDKGNIDWEAIDKDRDNYPISIAHDLNSISFKIQEGPIKEVGVNGCQVDTMIETAKIIIEKLNRNFPCSENTKCIICLHNALKALQDRKADREKRNVEGFNKA